MSKSKEKLGLDVGKGEFRLEVKKGVSFTQARDNAITNCVENPESHDPNFEKGCKKGVMKAFNKKIK